MKISPLQLERQFITAVHLDANLSTDVPIEGWEISSHGSVASHQTDPLRFKVDLTVNFHSPDKAKSPYVGSISLTGLYAVADSYPKDKGRQLVETNGPSILYGAAREMFANLTARGPFPMVMLPTQSFYEPKPATPSPKAPKEEQPSKAEPVKEQK